MVPPLLEDVFEREFGGETLVWIARPDMTVEFIKSFGFLLPAAPLALIGAMGTFAFASEIVRYAIWSVPTTIKWSNVIIVPIVLPVLVFGIALLLKPVFAWLTWKRTVYVLTDRRIVILETGRTLKVTSIMPWAVSEVTRREKPDGRGTLELLLGYENDSDGDVRRKLTKLGVVNDIHQVEKLMRNLLERQRGLTTSEVS